MKNNTIQNKILHTKIGITKRIFSPFEMIPVPLFYIPIVIYWLWLSLRYMSFTLPSLSNTSITAGGICGESKTEVLDSFGLVGKQYTANYFSAFQEKDESFQHFLKKLQIRMHSMNISFPIVIKPNQGRNGYGVQKINTLQELQLYTETHSYNGGILIQDFIPYEGEAGIFYIRHPHTQRGKIISLTLKFFPFVIGDGHSTLRNLILSNPRAKKISKLYFATLATQLDTIPKKDEKIPLVFVGNHIKGAIFRNGADFITEALTQRIDTIAQEMNGFYFGRFDVRYKDLKSLQQGTDFFIIELNGAGSESTHIWDADMTLHQAYIDLCYQLKLSYEIGAHVRRRGLRPIGPFKLLKLYFKEIQEIRRT